MVRRQLLIEGLAILDEATDIHQDKTSVLIRKQNEDWGNLSILEIIEKSHHLRIFEHSTVQEKFI